MQDKSQQKSLQNAIWPLNKMYFKILYNKTFKIQINTTSIVNNSVCKHFKHKY